MLAAVSRLKHNGVTVGTGFRVEGTCLFVCSRHSAVDGDTCLEGLTAFNKPITFKEAYPRLDTIVFEGPPGPGLPLSSRPLVPGTRLWLLSYPFALDEVFEPPGPVQGLRAAAILPGAVASVSRCGDRAATTCCGKMSRSHLTWCFQSTVVGQPRVLLRDSLMVAGESMSAPQVLSLKQIVYLAPVPDAGVWRWMCTAQCALLRLIKDSSKCAGVPCLDAR